MSLKIGRFFGINLYIHGSFWLLPLWVAFSHARDPEAGAIGMHLGLLAALFGCVVLHEYGHALAARVFGIATRDVSLYPIGGVARLERMSDRPVEEFCIAIAGPLVNLAIAAVLAAGLGAVAVAQPALLQGVTAEFLTLLLLMNVVLFVFNLLPAFPMDGGRVLRAILTAPLGRIPATRVAVYVSAGMAVLFGIGGLFLLHNPWLVFVGLFLIWAGQQELFTLERRQRQEQAAPEPITPEILPEEPAVAAWAGVPHSSVTVYLWDPRKHAWVVQGVIPGYPRAHY